MKLLSVLENVQGNQARIYDYQHKTFYQIELTDDEVMEYQSLLDEAKKEELDNEETGVFVVFNTDTEQIEPADDEMELF